MINTATLKESLPAVEGFISQKLDDLAKVREYLENTELPVRHDIDLTTLRTIDAGNQAREQLGRLKQALDGFVEMLSQVQEDVLTATAQ